MDKPETIKTIGPVDVAALQGVLAAQPAEPWRADRALQKKISLRRTTETIYLMYAEGWPDPRVQRYAGWQLLFAAARPIMVRALARYPQPGRVVNAMLAKLPPGGTIPAHTDAKELFAWAHRLHVPLSSNPEIEFLIARRPVHMKVGIAYEINNRKVHSVRNQGTTDRIHFIFDYLPTH